MLLVTFIYKSFTAVKYNFHRVQTEEEEEEGGLMNPGFTMMHKNVLGPNVGSHCEPVRFLPNVLPRPDGIG